MVSIADKRILAFIPRTFIITISAIVCGLAIFCYPCFADSDSKESESVSLEEFTFLTTEILRDQELHLNETSPADAVRATDYAQLIYNYLTSNIAPNQVSIMTNLNGGSSNNPYLYNIIKDLRDYGVGTSHSSNLSLYDMVLLLDDYLWGPVTNHQSGFVASALTSLINNTAGGATNTYVTNSKLDVLNNSINNLSWHDWKTTADFVAFKSSLDQSIITGQTVSATSPNPNGSYYAQFTGSYVYANSNGMVLDVCVPMYSRSFQKSVTIKSVAYDDSRIIDFWQSFTYYDDYCVHFIIFLLEPPPSTDPINFVFIVESGNWILANNAQGAITKAYIKYIDFTENDYHVLNMSISQDIEGRNVHAIRQLLNNLCNELASPDMIAAKQESTPQIDEFYDKFTGDGSSAASVSDISNASEISDSVTAGLSTGQQIDDALGVFNPASAFFGWFSTDNAQYFTVYSPQRSIDNWDNVVWTDDEPVLHNVLEEGIYK